ncbi:hypothetical protein M5W83_27755, partial [Paenibacillus thiaminolyticus]
KFGLDRDVDSLSQNSCKIAAISATRSSPGRQGCFQQATMPPVNKDASKRRRCPQDPTRLLDPVNQAVEKVQGIFLFLFFQNTASNIISRH